MKTSRRGLLRLSAQSLVGLSLAPLWPSPAKAKGSGFTGNVSVVQLVTNEDSAQFAVLKESPAPFVYRVFKADDDTELPTRLIGFSERAGSPFGVEKLRVDGLADQTWYRLEILDPASGRLLDSRQFKNLPLSVGRRARFALISCALDGVVPKAKEMWQSLWAERPEMIFFVGDTSYADVGISESDGALGRWHRYGESRKRLALYHQEVLIPVFAVWDDHDYGVNNGDRFSSMRDSMLSMFRDFWECEDVPGFKKTSGVGFQLSGFGQKFYFMDNRSFRDTRFTTGMHWGSEQQEVLLTDLETLTKPAWIFSGSQFFGCYKNLESFMQDHPQNFVDLLKKLSKINAPVVFGSGDVHFSEVMKLEPSLLGYQTYEFTSSSIHSTTSPHFDLFKNSRRDAYVWKHNFLLIEAEAQGLNLKIQTRSVGRAENYFTHQAVVRRS